MGSEKAVHHPVVLTASLVRNDETMSPNVGTVHITIVVTMMIFAHGFVYQWYNFFAVTFGAVCAVI
jgi:hypothetical protein